MPAEKKVGLCIFLDEQQRAALKVAAARERKSLRALVLERLEPDIRQERERQQTEMASAT
ncbi:MAG TPA: hypothetical protein VFU63_05485 [Ktedonobacterales bacterium]|nr:hypothetical protein [Ktedonobacterales bacterium]